MKKTRKFLTALVIFVSAVIWYLTKNLQIYHSPYFVSTTDDNAPLLDGVISNNKLKVLVWNIHKGADKGWREDLTRLAQNADFVLLQEATNKQGIVDQFKPQFPITLHLASFSYNDVRSGLATLAKAKADTFYSTVGKEPWLRIPKVASAVRFPMENGEFLLVVNVHLVNFEWQPTHYQKQLSAVADWIEQHQGAVILGGDFNTWNTERLILVQKMAQRLGLTEVKFGNDQRTQFLGKALDHIFIRGLTVKQATTETVTSSDHNPLLVELEFSSPIKSQP